METRCSWAQGMLKAASSGPSIAARTATVRSATTVAGPSRPPKAIESQQLLPDTSSSSSSGSSSSPPPGDETRTLLQRILPWVPVAIPVAAVLYTTTYSIGTVNGGSMVPTLNPEYSSRGISAPRDWVILNRLRAMSSSWQVGDVVVMVSPIDPNTHSVKRILAMPGDIVRYPYKRRVETSPGHYRQVSGHKRIKIPPGHCWVEGDSSIYANAQGDDSSASGSNRSSSRGRREAAHLDLSRDSRHFGPIPLALLTAKVSLIFYPFDRLGPIPDRPGQGPRNLGAAAAAAAAAATEGGKSGPRTGWWPFTGGSGAGAGSGASGGPEEEDWWKRAEEDSRLTPYADEESQAAGAEVGRQRVRFMDSGAAAPAAGFRPQEGQHGLSEGDEAQTVPVSWALFSRRARNGETLYRNSEHDSGLSVHTDATPALLRAPHRHVQEPTREDGAAFAVEPRRRALYKQKHASDLSAEEVELRRRRLNAMSRGGKLGDAQLEEEEEEG